MENGGPVCDHPGSDRRTGVCSVLDVTGWGKCVLHNFPIGDTKYVASAKPAEAMVLATPTRVPHVVTTYVRKSYYEMQQPYDLK